MKITFNVKNFIQIIIWSLDEVEMTNVLKIESNRSVQSVESRIGVESDSVNFLKSLVSQN